jgi:hypothetical protein
MTQNAAETPGAPRPPSFARRRPLFYYKPQVLKLIHFLEQTEPMAVVNLARLDARHTVRDDPDAASGDDA